MEGFVSTSPPPPPKKAAGAEPYRACHDGRGEREGLDDALGQERTAASGDRKFVGEGPVEVRHHRNAIRVDAEGDDALARSRCLVPFPRGEVAGVRVVEVERVDVPPARPGDDDDGALPALVEVTCPVVDDAVPVEDVKLHGRAAVRIQRQLLAPFIVVGVGVEDQIDLLSYEEIQDVRAGFACVLARADAVLVHPHDHPRDPRGSGLIEFLTPPLFRSEAWLGDPPVAETTPGNRETGACLLELVETLNKTVPAP